jgi:hypothetical protein
MSYQKLINCLDLYGYSPYFFVGGDKRSGSLIGLISTITSIIVGIIISFYFIMQLFDTKDLTVITSETTPEGIESIKLTKDTFYFTFSLEDPISYKSFINENIYYPIVFYKYAIRNKEEGFIWSKKKLDFGPCEINDFGKDYQRFFKNHNLKQMYCLKNINETLKGIFQKSEYSFINIEMYECKNSSEKKTCKSKDEIDYYLNGSFISIEYQGLTIDPKNFSYPNIPKISEYYTTVSKNYFKEIHLYFKKVIVKTDKGIIFQKIDNKEFVIFDHSEDMISFKTINSNFLEISVKFADRINEYLRSYTKAQTVISNIGGFLKFIQGTFWIISYIFVENEVYQKILNKIFYCDVNIIHRDYKLFQFNNQNINSPINKKSISNVSLLQLNINEKSNFKTSLMSHKPFEVNISNVSKNSIEPIKKNNRDSIYEKVNSSNKVLQFLNINNNKSHINSVSLIENILNKNISNAYSSNLNPHNSYNNKFCAFMKNTKKLEKFIKKNKENDLKLKYCERFCLKLSQKKNRNKIGFYKKGIGLIEQKLDIISIIKDSFQLSLLKKMFFNQEHIIIMDKIIKIELSGERYDEKLNNIDNEENYDDKVITAYNIILDRFKKAYNKKEKYNELENMDYYFIQLVNEQYACPI